MPDVVLVFTTAPDAELASLWARTLVEERLAACVNLPALMTSFYRWKGTLERAAECQLVIKTARDRVHALRTRLLALHTYDVPEFIVVRVEDGSEQYLQWIVDETRP